MKRRGFLGLIAGAVAAFAAKPERAEAKAVVKEGLTAAPEPSLVDPRKVYVGREADYRQPVALNTSSGFTYDASGSAFTLNAGDEIRAGALNSGSVSGAYMRAMREIYGGDGETNGAYRVRAGKWRER